jgi:hypothetical protein
MKLLCALLLVAAMKPAFADWTEHFARVTCIPELGYFSVDYKAINSYAAYADRRNNENPLDAWRKHGYLPAWDIAYQCELSEATYNVTTTQPAARATGMCGADPEISMTVVRNTKVILQSVVFGRSCFEAPSVVGYSASEPPVRSGMSNVTMTLQIVPRPFAAVIEEFLMQTYGDIEKAIPIDQAKVEKYGAAAK